MEANLTHHWFLSQFIRLLCVFVVKGFILNAGKNEYWKTRHSLQGACRLIHHLILSWKNMSFSDVELFLSGFRMISKNVSVSKYEIKTSANLNILAQQVPMVICK